MEGTSRAAPASPELRESEEFALSLVRVWRRDGELLLRVVNRAGTAPGDEHAASHATADIDEAMELVRAFISDFAST